MPPRPHLFERLCDPRELERAWLEVLAHYPRERVPAELREVERKRGKELQRLSESLRNRTFLPEAASLILIPKPDHPGEQRPITLVLPDDRVVLTALNRILRPLFERRFLPHAYAYRPGRGAFAAVERVTHCLHQGLVYAASGDIDNFFVNIDRQGLFREVSRIIYERPVLDLIETYLHMGVARDFEWADTGRGIAQGSPLSPLLSNVALAPFDSFLENLGVEWVRYADNFILLAQAPEICRERFERAEAFLDQHCGLRLNPESRVFASEAEGFDFLGFKFCAGRRTMTAAKLDQKRLKIAEILRQHSTDLRGAVREIALMVKGWKNYYGLSSDTRDQLVSLERHLADLLAPWLQRFRGLEVGRKLPASDLKAVLAGLELPATAEPRQKLKWIELLLARSRPKRESPPGPMSLQARKAIEQRKKEYQKLKQDRQEVLITKPGTYLGRTGERLLIRHEGKREAEVPLSMVRNITLLTKAVSLSGELMSEASARGINIVLSGADGRPVVRIGAAEVAEHQLSLTQSEVAASRSGLELARIIVAGKIRNQANLLRYYLKYPERRADGDFLTLASQAVKDMEAVRTSVLTREFGVDLNLERNRLFAAEGQAAASYWSAVRSLLWWKPGFTGRVRRGAGDIVNSMLNYGYGILYSRLLSVLVRTGLNIYIGFLHKPQSGKAGLLYDFIEEFRAAAVDRVVFGMLNLGAEAEIGEQGLQNETRHALARKVVQRIQAETRYHGELAPLEHVMDLQAQRLVRHIKGDDLYRTYVLPW